MAKADKLLERMRYNPRDWRIEDIVTVCEGLGIACNAPRKGSHYKVKHSDVREILTIPAHRPIKPVYIRDLIKFIDSMLGEKS
jgi:predicted RNA binding protein YcfA (HicA-like mRNA interferase family)